MTSAEKAEGTLRITFRRKELLLEALTHRSYLNEHARWPVPHNERLEYLGDAVLELIVSEALYERFPDSPEGELTVLRAALVNYQMLARVARDAGLDDCVFMSRGEAKDTGKAREVILANAFEAVIGAIYLDLGIAEAKRFVETHVLAHLDEVLATRSYKDAKSELQEIIQERLKLTPTYKVHREEGPAHLRTFHIGVYFGDECIAEGEGSSKQEAEIEAARKAIAKYRI